jgi:16S rRNA (guanine1207-N2)-methyltransferase
LEHYFTSNENLKSEFRLIEYEYNNIKLSFLSDLGVFSKDKIDYGSRFLIETFLKNNDRTFNNVLDVGCGYGFMGLTIGKVLHCHVDMVDVNKRAVHLSEMNIGRNEVDAKAFVSNAYESITDKYDLIITNPPIRAGNKVLIDILAGAEEHLNKDGELWYVMRKDQGAKSFVKKLNNVYNLELIEKSKGFYVYRAKKH